MKPRSLRNLAWYVPLPREQKLALTFLASIADDLTGQRAVSKATLMQATGLTEEELRVALAALKAGPAAGRALVTWERREQQSNLYTVHRAALERLAMFPKRKAG